MSILYPCYSVPLMKYLTETKGIRYELVCRNINNDLQFWIFVKGDSLDKALNEWKDNRKYTRVEYSNVKEVKLNGDK